MKLTPEALLESTDVSRETLAALSSYLDLLLAWQPRINLVSKDSLQDPWRRHVLDSVQLVPHLGAPGPVVDLGSGAGFPGIVIALVTGRTVHLIESDQRKAAFLREAARVTGAPCHIHCQRIESLTVSNILNHDDAAAITARACAPLSRLLDLAAPLMADERRLVFLKGQGLNDELTEARKSWTITSEILPSRSDPSGRILLITHLQRNEPPS